jgi:hypothetical protein
MAAPHRPVLPHTALREAQLLLSHTVPHTVPREVRLLLSHTVPHTVPREVRLLLSHTVPHTVPREVRLLLSHTVQRTVFVFHVGNCRHYYPSSASRRSDRIQGYRQLASTMCQKWHQREHPIYQFFPHSALSITSLLTQVRVSTIVSVAGGSDRSPCSASAGRNCKGVFNSETHLTVTSSLTITYLLKFEYKPSCREQEAATAPLRGVCCL